ncbi:hypothetical protein KY362_07530 [Candidatus Woesearchaeota archaeon]|nr:hypothetical protein [Candidatus Woesearchaeota archaeon]
MLVNEFIQPGEEVSPPLYNTSLLMNANGWNIKKYYKPYYRKSHFNLFFHIKGNQCGMYYYVSRAKSAARDVLLDAMRDPDDLAGIDAEFFITGEKIKELYDILNPGFVKTAELDNVFAKASLILDLTWQLAARSFFSMGLDKDVVEDNTDIKDFDSFWERASVPTSESFDRRRLRLVEGLKAGGCSWDEIAVECEHFDANFGRITDTEEVRDILKAEYADRKFDEDAQLQKALEDYNNHFSNHPHKTVADFIQLGIKLRDVRKDYFGMALVAMSRVARRVSEESGVPVDLLLYSTFLEVMKGIDFIKGLEPELKRRMAGCSVIVRDDLSTEFEYGTDGKSKQVLTAHLKGCSEEGVVKGQTGCRGKVRGKVRIVTILKEQGPDFQDGEILVTGMTRPEFVPLMKRAKAVITDEGSITCHAAIVSRELNIPCIIGTKIATQVLKDGDEVEVDADKGVVRIL